MRFQTNVQSPCNSCIVAGALLAALAAGCAADAGATDGSRASGDEGTEPTLGTLKLGLHALPGIALLSWRGAPPRTDQTDTDQPGLNVVYQVRVGIGDLIGGFNDRTITGLRVCWYTPSGSDNLYRFGDPFGCQDIGDSTFEEWGTVDQRCPDGEVVSGYRYAVGDGGDTIERFGVICRSVSDPNVTTTFEAVGDTTNFLFTDTLDCTSFFGQTAYVEFFAANPKFSGFNGACVAQ